MLLRRAFGLSFDGTPLFGDLFGAIVRIMKVDPVTKVKTPRELLVGLRHSDKSPNADILTAMIDEMLFDGRLGYGLSKSHWFGVTRDDASVNGAALGSHALLAPNRISLPCFSHIFNRIGLNLSIPQLSAFLGFWNQLFAHSGNAVAAYRAYFQAPFPVAGTHNRWFYFMPIYRSILANIVNLDQFLATLEQSQSVSGMRNILRNPRLFQDLHVELQAAVHYGTVLERCCYALEGDDVLIFIAQHIVMAAIATIETDAGYLVPLVEFYAAQDETRARELGAKSRNVVLGARNYLAEQRNKHSAPFFVLKMAALWHPLVFRDTKDETVVEVR